MGSTGPDFGENIHRELSTLIDLALDTNPRFDCIPPRSAFFFDWPTNRTPFLEKKKIFLARSGRTGMFISGLSLLSVESFFFGSIELAFISSTLFGFFFFLFFFAALRSVHHPALPKLDKSVRFDAISMNMKRSAAPPPDFQFVCCCCCWWCFFSFRFVASLVFFLRRMGFVLFCFFCFFLVLRSPQFGRVVIVGPKEISWNALT